MSVNAESEGITGGGRDRCERREVDESKGYVSFLSGRVASARVTPQLEGTEDPTQVNGEGGSDGSGEGGGEDRLDLDEDDGDVNGLGK